MRHSEQEHPELFALEVGKIAEYDFVYTLSSTDIDQSTPNLVQKYVIIRSQIRSIMDLIGPELSELSALELENLPYLTFVKNCCIRLCLLSNIYKYKPISTKLGHNEYEHKISDEFDYGSSHTRSIGVLSP